MKNVKKKLFLFLTLGTLLIPAMGVYAEEPDEKQEPTASATPVPTAPVDPTPTESPKPTPTPPTEPTTPEKPKEEDTEAKLSGLKVSQGTWNTKFSPTHFDYTITVKPEVSGIIITPDAYGNGTVTGDTGTKSLQNGENTFKITVTAKEGGNTNTYTLKVIRATDNLKLKSLKIRGQNLNEIFSANTKQYTADVTYNVQSITVQAAAEDDHATVSVTGSSNLSVGRNVVRIIVKNEVGDEEEYQIIVNRSSEEDLGEESPTDDDDENDTSESILSSTDNTQIQTPTKKKNNTVKYVLVVVFCMVLLAIAGLGIYFYMKTGDSAKRREKKIEKLKKKQEKLNKELTGLIPIIPEQEEIKEEDSIEELEEAELIDELDELEDTIELEPEGFEEEIETKKRTRVERKSDQNVLEDIDDLFLDE